MLLTPLIAKADSDSVYVTYYTLTDGRGWPYPGVIACPRSLDKGTLVRILGLNMGSYDEFTGKRDLFVCEDRYAPYLPYRFDVWQDRSSPSFRVITGYYNYQILGNIER